MSLKINVQLCQQSFHYCFYVTSFKYVTFPGTALPVSAAEASSEGQGHGKRQPRLKEQKAEITAIRISRFFLN
jgi:hypothetical protein